MARTPNNHHVLPLFCDDLIASCVDMTPGRFGAYMRILCYAWTRGGVPNDHASCARIAGGLESGDWDAIRARLIVLDAGTAAERLSHQRLELERAAVAELKEKKSKAGTKGNKARWGSQATKVGSQSDRKAIAGGIASTSQTHRKTIAPTPTPTPSHSSSLRSEEVIHTHATQRDEPWAGKALDLWTPFRDQWNSTPGAEPWKPLTPPAGSLWVDRVCEPAWIEQYPIALSKLAGLKRFKNAVTLTQFLSDGWVGRIVAGDFDKPQEPRGGQSPAAPPPVDSAKRRFFRSDSQQSMTDAEYAAWRRDRQTGGTATALARTLKLKDEET